MSKRMIEVFTAGCPLCDETLKLARESISDCGCELVERRCGDDECCEPANRYGIRVMPSVVVNGEIIFEGRISATQASLLKRQ